MMMMMIQPSSHGLQRKYTFSCPEPNVFLTFGVVARENERLWRHSIIDSFDWLLENKEQLRESKNVRSPNMNSPVFNNANMEDFEETLSKTS